MMRNKRTRFHRRLVSPSVARPAAPATPSLKRLRRCISDASQEMLIFSFFPKFDNYPVILAEGFKEPGMRDICVLNEELKNPRII